MIIIKHFFGGFSYSLVNPSVFAVAVLWLAGAYLFGQIELTADMLTSRNPSQQLIETGIFPTAAFDSSVTETLNNAIFRYNDPQFLEGRQPKYNILSVIKRRCFMFLLLCFILFIWGVAGLCSDYDHEAEVRNARRDAERRHKETVNALRSKGTTRITRTIARDENGRIIAQEVTEDFIPDMDEISEEDYE